VVSVRLPFDPENPPERPPAASEPLVWRLAYRIHRDHQPDQDGRCVLCRPPTTWPCPGSRLSARGFLAALNRRYRPLNEPGS
jgi:hypothetical protein